RSRGPRRRFRASSLPRRSVGIDSAARNDNDKAGRYLVKRDPEGHLRWLLGNRGLTFHAWTDARRVVLPNQGDLTNDLVAAVRLGDTLEAFCLELESEARADALPRLLRYLSQLGARGTVYPGVGARGSPRDSLPRRVVTIHLWQNGSRAS